MEYHGVFTVSKKENFRYNLYTMMKKLVSTCLLVMVIIALLLGVTRYSAAMVKDFASPMTHALQSALPFALGGGILLFALNVLFLWVRLNSMYKKGDLKDFSQDITLTDAGLHAVTESGTLDLPYEKLIKITETGKDFYLSFTENMAYVLPKDQMQDPAAESNTIREIFSAHMNSSKLKLKG